VIAEASRATGLEVELLLSDNTYFFAAIRLLVRSGDLKQVSAVFETSDSAGRPDHGVIES